MHERLIRNSFMVFHSTLAAVVFLQSIITIVHTVHSPKTNPLGEHLVVLAAAEAIASLLLLYHGTIKTGGIILILIFAFVFIFHALHGELELTLLVYSAGVVFIMFHESALKYRKFQQSSAAM